jgi:hypothetical protein
MANQVPEQHHAPEEHHQMVQNPEPQPFFCDPEVGGYIP